MEQQLDRHCRLGVQRGSSERDIRAPAVNAAGRICPGSGVGGGGGHRALAPVMTALAAWPAAPADATPAAGASPVVEASSVVKASPVVKASTEAEESTEAETSTEAGTSTAA